MLLQYVQALFFIFAAEMGDKTQILAMMFATKYKTSKVLLGIMIGSALNHGLAVIFGTLLGKVIPIYVLQIIAGVAFVGFAAWTLLVKEEDDENQDDLDSKKVSKSAILVVAMAFFLGELGGDKTQLTAITLSVSTAYPIIVLLGTVSGMIVTSGIGIFVGSKIGDKLPEALIKVVSSAIFLSFGILKLISSTPENLVNGLTVGIFVMVVGTTFLLLLRTTFKAHKNGVLTPYGIAARTLYDYAHKVESTVDELCRGVNHCGQCSGELCAVGFIRHLAKEMQTDAFDHNHQAMLREIKYHKDKFSRRKLVHVLQMNIKYLVTLEAKDKGYDEINMIREILELMLFEEVLAYEGSLAAYKAAVGSIDPDIDWT